MSEAVSFAVYAGIGVLVAIAILVSPLWFANAAKKGNVRFGRKQHRSDPTREKDSARTE